MAQEFMWWKNDFNTLSLFFLKIVAVILERSWKGFSSDSKLDVSWYGESIWEYESGKMPQFKINQMSGYIFVSIPTSIELGHILYS